MALKTCRDCGHKVSTRAKACPVCGFPLKRMRVFSPGCGCLVLLLLVMCSGLLSLPDKANEPEVDDLAQVNDIKQPEAKRIPGPLNEPVALTFEVEVTDGMPKDLTYTIIDKNIVPGIKKSLDIRLNKKVSEDVLKSIAMELKNSDSNSYERTFIGYYLPEMKVDAGYWATTHFNPVLEIRILGLTVEQEKALKQQPAIPSREIIGSWLQDEEPFPGRIIIFRKDRALYMEKTYSDGNIGKDQMVEKPSNKGRKLMKAKRTGPDHDYYLIDNSGNLQIWSQDVDGTHVLVLTAKKIIGGPEAELTQVERLQNQIELFNSIIFEAEELYAQQKAAHARYKPQSKNLSDLKEWGAFNYSFIKSQQALYQKIPTGPQGGVDGFPFSSAVYTLYRMNKAWARGESDEYTTLENKFKSELQQAKNELEELKSNLPKTQQRVRTSYPATDDPKQPSNEAQASQPNQATEVETKPTSEDNEKAAGKLRLAKKLLESGNRSAATKWLKGIVEEYGNTPAGKEASEILQREGT